jgi:transcriptional regulator with XRE-family HTH domain
MATKKTLADGKAGMLTESQNEAVRALLRGMGKNQVELAKDLGVAQAGISRFLSGKQGTSMAVAIKICEAVGREYHEVLGLPGRPQAREVTIDPFEQSPRDAARVAFVDGMRNDHPENRIRSFLNEFDARPHSGAGTTFDWWLTAYREAWRQHRAAAKGKGGPFGMGVR